MNPSTKETFFHSNPGMSSRIARLRQASRLFVDRERELTADDLTP